MTVSLAPTDFEALTEPFRKELLAHCYRMLGSVHDAEDLVQETYLRAWRGFDRFEGRASVRVWLHTIATRTCLTALEGRARRALPSDLGPASALASARVLPGLEEVPWVGPAPSGLVGDVRVRLAFIAALQHLSAGQRAVLLLRDVLAFRAAEVAPMLSLSPDAVNSLLRRARARLAEVAPVEEEVPAFAAWPLLEAYVVAFQRADVAGLAALMRADVELEMPPTPTWFVGVSAVSCFIADRAAEGNASGKYGKEGWELSTGSVNSQPSLTVRRGTVGGGESRRAFHGVHVFSVRGGLISRIVAFNDPLLERWFG